MDLLTFRSGMMKRELIYREFIKSESIHFNFNFSV